MEKELIIPETIIVHLEEPDKDAVNVTVSFPEYIKNVASNDIVPTWPENALKAAIYEIITFAISRIFTNWYRSKGYNFDITNSPQYDRKFIDGHEIFENISNIVDEIFYYYIANKNSSEPVLVSQNNQLTPDSNIASQWQTVELAKRGLTPEQILKHYYGDDIDIVNAPVVSKADSSPNYTLKRGTESNGVRELQVRLNQISRNYPDIPKIPSADGMFDESTENAVRKFQEIFNLPVTGVVNETDWYKILYIYAQIKRLATLNAEGLSNEDIRKQYQTDLNIGMQSPEVRALQYYLAVISAYYQAIPAIDITGYYGNKTEQAVKAFKRIYGLPQTGKVDGQTWIDIFRAYDGIMNSIPIEDGSDVILYPGRVLKEGMSGEDVKLLQEYLSYINQTYPNVDSVENTGYYGPITRSSVLSFQKQFKLAENGIVGSTTWNKIAGVYSDLKYGADKKTNQNPGYVIE